MSIAERNARVFEDSAEATETDAGCVRDIRKRYGLSLIVGERLRNPSGISRIHSFGRTAKVCGGTVRLLSHAPIVDEKWHRIERIECVPHDRSTVYNLGVADDQSYHANGMAVHNCRCVTVPVWSSDIEAGEERKAEGNPQPDEGWDFNAGKVFEDLLRAPLAASVLSPQRCTFGNTRGGERVLLALESLGGSAKQSDIARLIGRTSASVSDAVCGLAEHGLVHHGAAVHQCRITDAGRERVAGLRKMAGRP